MSNINDLFISYKIVNGDNPTVLRFDPNITTLAILNLSVSPQNTSIHEKADLAKARVSSFLWTSGGAKEPEYTLIANTPTISDENNTLVNASKSSRNSGYQSTKDFIKAQESFRSSRYKDGGGQSIGYGFYGDTYWKGNTITRELADRVLDNILNEQESFLSKFSVWSRLNNNQKTALHSYLYNVGLGKFSEDSEMGKALKSGDLLRIHNAINIVTSLGKRNEALVRRRELEKQLFKS